MKYQSCSNRQSDSAVFCQEVRPRSDLMRLQEIQFLCSRSPLAQTSSGRGFISNTTEVLRELNISDDVFEGVFLNPIFMSIMQWNSLFLLEKSDLVLLIFFFKEQLKKKASKNQNPVKH